MSFQNLPEDIQRIIVRKCLLQKNSPRLSVVCKLFHETIKEYYTIASLNEFVCRSCEKTHIECLKAQVCSSCRCISDYYSRKPKHYPKCKSLIARDCQIAANQCTKCKGFGYAGSCTLGGKPVINHNKNCDFHEKRVRGICGICIKCLPRLNCRECGNCGLEFMTPYKGTTAYCHTCLPEFNNNFTINPEWKEILPTEEPFCF